MYSHDNRVVITLDAGGTNLVFGAMQANRFIVEPITLPSHAEDLDKCLATMVEGFRAVISRLSEKPVAISFAFPGPADYPNGIIGGYLPNFPSFRDGVALGPFLEATFGIPVFINNDGDLFAYGEALGGALPEVNAKLEALGCPKRYKNLVGYTFGTGLGVGIGHFPARFHTSFPCCIDTGSGCVEGRGTRVDEVYDTVGGKTGKFFARNTFYGFGTPIGTYIGEHLSAAGQELTE